MGELRDFPSGAILDSPGMPILKLVSDPAGRANLSLAPEISAVQRELIDEALRKKRAERQARREFRGGSDRYQLLYVIGEAATAMSKIPAWQRKEVREQMKREDEEELESNRGEQ